MIERVPAGALATRSHPTHRQRGGTVAYRVCQAGRQKHYRLIQNRAPKLRFRHAEGCCQVTGSERPRARKKVNSCSLLTMRQSRVRNGHNRARQLGRNRRPTEKYFASGPNPDAPPDVVELTSRRCCICKERSESVSGRVRRVAARRILRSHPPQDSQACRPPRSRAWSVPASSESAKPRTNPAPTLRPSARCRRP